MVAAPRSLHCTAAASAAAHHLHAATSPHHHAWSSAASSPRRHSLRASAASVLVAHTTSWCAASASAALAADSPRATLRDLEALIPNVGAAGGQPLLLRSLSLAQTKVEEGNKAFPAHERRRGRTNTLLSLQLGTYPGIYMGDYLETTSGYYSHSGHIPLLPGGPPRRPAGLESGDNIFLTSRYSARSSTHTRQPL
jgi:hypothetical protein